MSKEPITSKATRDILLDAAFEEIYHKGFQAACIDDIIAKVGLTKGALYYYFPRKVDLGLAVIEEKVRPTIDEFWLPVVKIDDQTGIPQSHLDTLVKHIRENFTSLSSDICEFGCPLMDYVFAPADATTAGLIAHEVRMALARWEPRVEVVDVTVTAIADTLDTLWIDITYQILDTYDRRNLVFPFYVIPEHEPAELTP